MIAQIQGTIVDVFEKGAVVDTGAIGYSVFTPTILSVGQNVLLYTHLVIREDAHELYGFQTKEERSIFNSLISVSGVGPKTALQMLMMYPISEIVRAIRGGDAKSVSLVPGIGKKTAEKIIIDLRDKLKEFVISDQASSSDLIEALLSLGFKDADVRSTLPFIDPESSLENQITKALGLLRK